jgi:hypothetical protein
MVQEVFLKIIYEASYHNVVKIMVAHANQAN